MKRGWYGLITEERIVERWGRTGSVEEEEENNINCVLQLEKTEEVHNVGLPLTIYKCTECPMNLMLWIRLFYLSPFHLCIV